MIEAPAMTHTVDCAVISTLRESTMVLNRNGTCTVVICEGCQRLPHKHNTARTLPATSSPRATKTRVFTSHRPLGQILVASCFTIRQSVWRCSACVTGTAVPVTSTVRGGLGGFVAASETVSGPPLAVGCASLVAVTVGLPVSAEVCLKRLSGLHS